MSQLATQYDPSEHEGLIYSRWVDAGVFAPDEESLAAGKKPFVISLPPPNITGSLHMGHALQDSIMDILARYHRMQGEPVVWLPGTDSAAIATNRVIENQLADEGTNRFEVGREAFMERTQKWYEETGTQIIEQMRRLGCSCDWERSRFTMDEKYLESVNEAFVRYYEAGYIYRGDRLVNWDPVSQTTVSDLEIDWKTEKTPFYTFRYGPFEIGTARPETKFGDKYVVMHPSDERYAAYKHGDTFKAEWINGLVTATVIKDEAAEPEFGTGVMTITPAHDATDFDIAKRHDLDTEQVIDFDGKLLPVAGDMAGLTIEEARAKVVARLDEKGLLVSVDENYEHNIALNDRGKGVIEPQLMRQWFVSMDKLKQPAIDAVNDELVRFVPPRWQKHFLSWMEKVYDWNINRQIWLGHRLPVWWKPDTHGTDQEEGSFKVSVEKPEGDWVQDPDVLDTWFATALWPFAQLGWPDNTTDLQRFYPTSVLVTARDIMYLWVARMIFSGLELVSGDQFDDRKPAAQVPFRDVFIHPTVLAKDGRRMSKSLGTGIDPLELIDEYGADATRFGLMYIMNYDNQAIRFDGSTIKTARNFANKIWNVARFIEQMPERTEPSVADEWIQARVSTVAAQVGELIEAYKLGEAARLIYDFVWSDLADWYVEILKTEGSTVVAKQVLIDTLRIVHPFMPFISEVLWKHSNPAADKLLMSSSWPGTAVPEQEGSTAIMRWQEIVGKVRSIRAVLGVPVSAVVQVSFSDPCLITAFERLTKSEFVAEPVEGMKSFPLVSGETVAIGSSELTDDRIQQAQQKMASEQKDLVSHIDRTQAAISDMRGKAPKEVVIQKEASLKDAKERLNELEKSIAALR